MANKNTKNMVVDLSLSIARARSCLFCESVLFPLVKLVLPDRAHIDYFRTAVPIFLELDTFLAIVGI
jgi:hypothetical protein